MKVLITGADGFLGSNLQLRLEERKDIERVRYVRTDRASALPDLLHGVDFVFHLAGVNRPQDPNEFATGNTELTLSLCNAVAEASRHGQKLRLIFTSSSQAALDSPYGQSKRTAEKALLDLSRATGVAVHVFRLPNVFGKWCKPDYNSAVATFCHNVARDKPIQINDPNAPLSLVYVDDVVRRFVDLLDGAVDTTDDAGFSTVAPIYTTTVGEVAAQIVAFKASRASLMTERVGAGLSRALYSTYISHLPADRFAYTVPEHSDARGIFVEMLKTPDCGQFSYFTAHPGVTRGGHYHHSKTEKFLVVRGRALFKFRHILTGETHEHRTSGETPEIVETIPGWAHDITNAGDDEMLVMLWANEVFDRDQPDTIAAKV
jgi:UDP-2-acetamido-2,6-beta-L-arabino-hexul-4-ose reductase